MKNANGTHSVISLVVKMGAKLKLKSKQTKQKLEQNGICGRRGWSESLCHTLCKK